MEEKLFYLIATGYKIINIFKDKEYITLFCKNYLKAEKIYKFLFICYLRNKIDDELKIQLVKFEFNRIIKGFIFENKNLIIFTSCIENEYINKVYKYDLWLNKWNVEILKSPILTIKGADYFIFNEEFYGIYGGYILDQNNKSLSILYNNFVLINKKNFEIKYLKKNEINTPELMYHKVVTLENYLLLLGGIKFSTNKSSHKQINNRIYKIKYINNSILSIEKLEYHIKFKKTYEYTYELRNNNIFIIGGYFYKNGFKKNNKYIIQIDNDNYYIYKINLEENEYILDGYFLNESVLMLIISKEGQIFLKKIKKLFFNNTNIQTINNKHKLVSKNKIKNLNKLKNNCEICDNLINEDKKNMKNNFFYINYLFKNDNIKQVLDNSLTLSKGVNYPFITLTNIMYFFEDSSKFEIKIKKKKFIVESFCTKNYKFLIDAVINNYSRYLEKFIKFLSLLYFLSNNFKIKINLKGGKYIEIKIIENQIFIKNKVNNFNINKIENSNIKIKFKLNMIYNKFVFTKNNILLVNNFIEMPNNFQEYLKLSYYLKPRPLIYLFNEKINFSIFSNKIYNSYYFKNNFIIKNIYLKDVDLNSNFSIIAVFNKNEFIKFIYIKNIDKKFYCLTMLNDLNISYFNNKVTSYLLNYIKQFILNSYIN